MNNILLAGVGVTAFPSFQVHAANHDASANALIKVAILPAVLLMILSFIGFSGNNFDKWRVASKVALNPVGTFKITQSGIFS